MTTFGKILILIGALVLAGCGGSDGPAGASGTLRDELPVQSDLNVLIVSFDALRADALGLYGNERGLSPTLDRFAEESLVFERAYSAAPVTPTSFASAFTGKWPFRVFLGWSLVTDTTLAQLLQQAGLYTFGTFNNAQLVAKRSFNQGFDQYEVVHLPDEQVAERAKELLSTVTDRQFFGWVHFISPHTPYDYREMAKHLYDPDYEGPFETTTGGEYTVSNDTDLKRVKDLYDGEVLLLDTLFADVMQHLEAVGLADNTIVIVTADHGEEFMDHGQLQHNAVYEEVIRIPFLVRHPTGKPGRTTVRYSNVDLLPTILGMLGVPYELDVDGVDVAEAHSPDRVILSTGMTHRTDRHYSAAGQADKLIVDCLPEYGEALYNLANDPLEMKNLIREAPELAEALLERAGQLTGGEPCDALQRAIHNQSPITNLSEEQIEQLKSLGYIQ